MKHGPMHYYMVTAVWTDLFFCACVMIRTLFLAIHEDYKKMRFWLMVSIAVMISTYGICVVHDAFRPLT